MTGLSFVAVTALVKYLGDRIPPAESAFLRYLLGLVFLIPMASSLRRARVTPKLWLLFASRGMVAVTVEYRVESKHHSTPVDAFEDAQMAMLWMRHNHASLGIDPDRIIAAGAASGAHMALSLAMQPEIMEIDGYNPRPQGVIALSALVNTTRKGMESERFPDAKTASKQSPSSHVRKGLPPSLFLHGKSDTIVPHEHVAKLAKMLKRKKNQCELVDFEAANHSFFNFNVSAKHFEIVLNSMDAFVSDLGYIEPMDYA